MKSKRKKYVLLAGGLTGGPIKPLLAVVNKWRSEEPDITPVIVDIKKSVSLNIAKNEGIEFKRIVAGKLRRYWSIYNLLTPILFVISLIQSFIIIRRYKPVLVMGAGGFVQLPLIVMAWICRIPRMIHQQDVTVSLSNQLAAPFANLITTTFEFSIRDFPQGTGLGNKYINGSKVYWTGNPTDIINDKVSSKDAKSKLSLHNQLPVLFIFGGGSGSQSLNKLITENLKELTKVVQILHITGIGKQKPVVHENYHSFEFADNMGDFYSAADIVIARAGIGTLTELAEFGKPSIIVPLPQTHQEMNAELLFRTKSALVLDQEDLDAKILINAIRKILFDPNYEKQLVHNLRVIFPKHAKEKVVELIIKLITHRGRKK